MSLSTQEPRERAKLRLWVEFVLFYIGVPIGLATLLLPSAMFQVLFIFTGVGLVLLHITPGFRWRSLLRGVTTISGPLVLLVVAATLLAGHIAIWTQMPEAYLFLLRNNPELMLLIAVFYPIVSALPQELVFRPLFFRRYRAILPKGVRTQIVLNAAFFSFAHLMYWSWTVLIMTFFGGLAFAWSYAVRGNFPEAVVLHAVAGVIVFALGLGVFFYSGNVVRPF